MEASERRKDVRQDIELQLEFAPSTEYGTPVTRVGVTSNVSPGGVLFHTNKGGCLRKDAELSVRIAIPRSKEDPGSPLALAGRARVRRVFELPQNGQGEPTWAVALMFNEKPSIRTGNEFWLVDED